MQATEPDGPAPSAAELAQAAHTRQSSRLLHIATYATLALPTAMAIGLWYPQSPWRAWMIGSLLSHMALVLTFMGGLHWGIAMRYAATNARMPMFHFVWGPLPGLFAWLALMADPVSALLLMIVVALWSYWVDFKTWPGSGLGPWMQLRSLFTLGTLCYSIIALLALMSSLPNV